MKKSILNLAGAKELTKAEQKSINGGKLHCDGTLIFVPLNYVGTCPCNDSYPTTNYSTNPACCC